jgi:transcriptional regulator with XRE-family HTH domain
MERPKRRNTFRRDGLTMFDALLLNGISKDGSQRAFAERSGIKEITLSRWLKGKVNPLSRREDPRKSGNQHLLGESLGYSIAAMRQLGSIGVIEACEIVLDHLDKEARHFRPPEDSKVSGSSVEAPKAIEEHGE